MKYVLIYYVLTTASLSSPAGVATGWPEFDSEQTCQDAKKALLATESSGTFLDARETRVRAECVKK